MPDSETWAVRVVNGWELYVRRAPGGARWEVSLCDRIANPQTYAEDGVLLSHRLDAGHFRDRTFASPDEAKEALRQIVAA